MVVRRNMGSSSQNIKDILTSFSPSSDFFAISSGDGRIKVNKNLTKAPID